MNLTIAAGVTIGCLAIPYLHAQSNSAGALLVLAKSDRTLSKVDLTRCAFSRPPRPDRTRTR